MVEAYLVKLPNMNVTGLHWWSVNIGAVRQQAITWANVDSDLCCHMVSLGHNELNCNHHTCKAASTVISWLWDWSSQKDSTCMVWYPMKKAMIHRMSSDYSVVLRPDLLHCSLRTVKKILLVKLLLWPSPKEIWPHCRSNAVTILLCIHLSLVLVAHGTGTVTLLSTKALNLRSGQNGQHFPEDIFKCTFCNGNVSTSKTIWLKFVLKGPVNNIPSLVQMMAWRWPGDKPLYYLNQRWFILLMHIWVNEKVTNQINIDD